MSRILTMRVGLAFGVLVAAYACGPRQVPPGTPPPEYEQREFPPWPEAGSADEPQPVLHPAQLALPSGAPEQAVPEPLDAGTGPAPLDAAPPDAGGTPVAP